MLMANTTKIAPNSFVERIKDTVIYLKGEVLILYLTKDIHRLRNCLKIPFVSYIQLSTIPYKFL